MHNLVVSVGKLRLFHQVFKHVTVLDFRYAKHHNAIRRVELVILIRAYRRDGIRHIVKLCDVFLGVPRVLALR